MVEGLPEKYKKVPQELQTIEWLVRMMDYNFKIPGTNWKFGIDFILGLFPGLGDGISFLISGLLVLSMVRHGVKKAVIVRMLGNIVLDAVVGSIPLLGNIFDLVFKANKRNYILLLEHQVHGKEVSMPWGWIVGIISTMVVVFLGMFIGFFLILYWIISLF